ncbi:MAG: helix-turn-helix transcriptional regulator [Gaiellaceae bacterium]
MNGALLTTREVADMLGLSPEAVLRRWRAGEIPGFRLSSRVLRFRESEVLAWLERKREGPRPPQPRLVGLDWVPAGRLQGGPSTDRTEESYAG